MSGDDKPSRFAMISEEMINPPELVKVEVNLDPGGLTWSGEFTVCPRCKLSAFELAPTISNQVRILCLGCSPPAPTYFLPEGTEVRVNPYRCCKCGIRARITMTLSEVNLHCRACKQLTLHTRQDPAPKKSTSIMSFLVDEPPKTSLFSWVKVKPEDSPFAWDDFDKPSGRQSVDARWENTTLGVPYQPETNPRDADKLIEMMRVALKLENFVDYAQKRRLLNAELVVKGAYDGNDIARRTGRTTRGLLETISQCICDNKREIVVRGGSARAEGHCFRTLKDILRGIADSYDRDLRVDLMMVNVYRHSDEPNRMYRRDAITYVDHTYNER